MGTSPSVQTLRTKELTKSYRGRKVVDNVSVWLQQGEVVGLLGPNGAGKTTTLRLVAGFMAPGLGTVSVLGGNPLSKEIRRDIGYLPEGAPLPPDLTVGEILDFTCRMRGIRRTNRSVEISRVMQPLALAALRYRNAEALSKGQRRRVALAAALILLPFAASAARAAP